MEYNFKKKCIAEGNTSYLAYVTNIKRGRYEKGGWCVEYPILS